MGWPGLHGHTVWHLGPAYLVGILLGHHGTCHLFHHLRKCHGHVRIFRDDAPGEDSSLSTNRNGAGKASPQFCASAVVGIEDGEGCVARPWLL